MTEPIHTGYMKQGKFIPDNPDWFKSDLCGFEGMYIQVIVKECSRSKPQNNYYWGVVNKIFTDFFNKEKSFGRVVSKDFVHEILTTKFLGVMKQTIPGGEIIELRRSSKNLSVKEFSDFIEYCMQWGDELFGLSFSAPPEKIKNKK